MERTLNDGVLMNDAATEGGADVRAGVLEGVKLTVEVPHQGHGAVQAGVLRRQHQNGAGGEVIDGGE